MSDVLTAAGLGTLLFDLLAPGEEADRANVFDVELLAGRLVGVSRGGRPDLARQRLALVTAPTLLIVGGLDHQVLALNRDAASYLTCEHRLAVVPGAAHLFEEPGALDVAASLARDWFLEHVPKARALPGPSSLARPSPGA